MGHLTGAEKTPMKDLTSPVSWSTVSSMSTQEQDPPVEHLLATLHRTMDRLAGRELNARQAQSLKLLAHRAEDLAGRDGELAARLAWRSLA